MLKAPRAYRNYLKGASNLWRTPSMDNGCKFYFMGRIFKKNIFLCSLRFSWSNPIILNRSDLCVPLSITRLVLLQIYLWDTRYRLFGSLFYSNALQAILIKKIGPLLTPAR
jgi:hypothetical protein